MNNVELMYPNDLHNFKEALARRNKQGEKKYVCESCGLVGWLKEGAETILIKRGNKEAIENCSAAGEGHITQATMTNPNVGKTVRLLKDISLSNGVTIPNRSEHILVKCPESHKKENNMSDWIIFNKEYSLLYASERELIDTPIQKEEPEEVVVEIEGEKSENDLPTITDAAEIPEKVFNEIIEKSNKQVDEIIEVMEEEQEVKIDDELIGEMAEHQKQEHEEALGKVLEKKTGVVQSTIPDEFKDGKFNLEDNDKIDYGFRMAEAEHKIIQFNNEIKREKKRIKDLIDDQQKIVDDLGSAIINGFEFRDILCELYLDYDKGKRLWRDKANGNVVKIEDMKPADYQMDFMYSEEENKEEEK